MKKKIRKAVSNPRILWMEGCRRLNRLYHTRFYTKPYNTDGIDVFAEDWDNLIILDACRLDYFISAGIEGELTTKESRGSATKEFIEANFSNRELHDVVYVSSNAWYARLHDEIDAEVHRFVNLERSEFQDEYLGVEPPDVVTDQALSVAEEYPNKRLVVHFMQPHYPYIGETGREHVDPKRGMTAAILDAGVSDMTIKRAYAENLAAVVPEVERLVDGLDGKSVVTADHGEILGEKSGPIPYTEYDHPLGTYLDSLVEVPWLIPEWDSRREIVAEPPADEEISDEGVEERLENLGYKL